METGVIVQERQPRTFTQKMKRAVAELIGRDRANRISAPFYDWVARRRTRECLARLPKSDLQINLGCGPRSLTGWVNVDLARGSQVDIVWDLRSGLPFGTESCSAVFTEHLIEHLSKIDGEKLLRECHRVLQPKGVLRLSTPDAGRFLRSYAGDGEFLRHPDFSEPSETLMDRINMMMREKGQHLWVYDAASLLLALERAGFSSPVEQSFGVSLHSRMNNIDCESRKFETLYVEALK